MDNIQNLLKQGFAELDKLKYRQALGLFQEAAKLEPQNPEVLYAIGLAYSRLENYPESLEFLNQALVIKPSYILALVRRGIVYEEQGLKDEATREFNHAINIEPQDYQDWRGRGIALSSLGKKQDALYCFEQAIELKPDDKNAWNSKGVSLYELGKYEEAIVCCDKALEINSNYANAWTIKGASLEKLGKYEEAIVCCDKALEINSNYANAWTIKGASLEKLGKYEEAIACYDQALGIDPNYAGTWNGKGWSLDELGKHEEAIACYDQALGIDPNYADAWNNKGFSLEKLGRHEEAIVCCDKALKINSNYASTRTIKGVSLAKLGKYEEAIVCYDQALEIDSKYANAWGNKGVALIKLGRYEEAPFCFDPVIEINPDDINAWNNKGFSLEKLGRHEEAIACCDKALEINSNYAITWTIKGASLEKLGRYEEAITCYDQALEIDSKYADAWSKKGVSLKELGRHKEAITCYDRALEINSKYADDWSKKGVSLKELGRHEEAIACYDRTLEIKSNYAETWNGKGWSLKELGRHEEAITCYDQALEIDSNHADTWNNKGISLSKLGRYKEAISCCNKAIKIDSNHKYAWSNKGGDLYQLGKYEKAIACCDKALNIDSNYASAWTIKGLLLTQFKQYKEGIYCYDEALRLTKNQGWMSWSNKGKAVFDWQGYNAALKIFSQGIQAILPETTDYNYGRGMLYYELGNIQYFYSRKLEITRPFWRKAALNYIRAIKILDIDKYGEDRLKIYQDLLKLCGYLGQQRFVKIIQDKGTGELRRLLENSCPERKIRLSRKFAGFDQLQVDQEVHNNPVKGLELAEKYKNRSLVHLQEDWDAEIPCPTYAKIQSLLNSDTAAIYWHISPVALTTFVLKCKQSPVVVQPLLPQEKIDYSATTYQCRRFEKWIKEWQDDYQDYRHKDLQEEEAAKHPWREKMEYRLFSELRDILQLRIIWEEYLPDIEHLILIPHQKLHWLPLDTLFPRHFTITYLPNAHLGIKLQQAQKDEPGKTLLSVQEPENELIMKSKKYEDAMKMLYAQIESELVAQLYHPSKSIPGEKADYKTVTNELRQKADYFHFTGHGYHNIDEPLESALALAGEDLLTFEEIINLEDLSHYHLVCLSSCETGITSSHNLVDEYIGLVSGFLAVGVTYVISSLWTVNEVSSALLMIRFHQLLQQQQPLNPPAALKQAQDWLKTRTWSNLVEYYEYLASEMAQLGSKRILRGFARQAKKKASQPKPPYDHPYHWAGFIITGKTSLSI